jgi:hypothetical protein
MSIEAVGEWLQATALGEHIRAIEWMVPLLQSIHILLIGVVFVSIIAVAARVLGWWRVDESLAQVWRRFAPFLWTGVVAMAVTGGLLVISEPLRELMTLSFRIKMLLLLLGIISAVLFGRHVRAAVPAAQVSPGPTRLAAIATVVLWLAIIILGRAIAYDDQVWGEWSPAVLQRGGSSQ